MAMKLFEFVWVFRLISRCRNIDVFAFRAFIWVALCICFFVPLLATLMGAEPTPAPTSKAKPPEWAYGTGPAEALRPALPRSRAAKPATDNSPQHLPGTTL